MPLCRSASTFHLRRASFGLYSVAMPEQIPTRPAASKMQLNAVKGVTEIASERPLAGSPGTCPDCETSVVDASGCVFCPGCGWGRCQ